MSRRPHKTALKPGMDRLEDRLVLTGPSAAAQEALVTMKGGQALGAIYQEFEAYTAAGGTGAFTPAEANRINFRGTSVGIDIRMTGGDFNSLVGQLKGIGMQVTATAPRLGIVEGYLPISELPTVASNSHEASLAPVYKPVTRGTSTPTGRQQTVVAAKAGTDLDGIYQEYLAYTQAGSSGTFTSTRASQIYFQGTSVGVDIRVTGDATAIMGQLKGIGMKVTATARPGQVTIIEGYLPISQLPTVSSNSHVVGLAAIFKPRTN